MARLIPTIKISSIRPRSEQRVARALVEQLPQDCVIYHSYPWLRAESNLKHPTQKTLQEGEIDFVILWPEYGLLVLEVKGGMVEENESNRSWYSTDSRGKKHSIKDPFEQASNNIHFIVNQLKKRRAFSRFIPFTFGYAVCFSSMEYRGGIPPGSHPAIILDKDDLPKMRRSIASSLTMWSRDKKSHPIAPIERKKIEQVLCPTFHLISVLSRQIETEEVELIRMTEDQISILTVLRSNSRIAIEGVAGSGKTLLALEEARRCAEGGKKTVLLCYNKALAKWMGNTLKHPLIDVYHFHGLIEELCKRASVPFSIPGPGDPNASTFWVETCIELFMEALCALPDRYDAVIVDEAQDFHKDWWLAIDELNRKGREGFLYIFYDPMQRLFDVKNALPDMLKMHMPANCRNTRQIAGRCSQILGLSQKEEIKVRVGAPVGEDCEEKVIEESESRLRQLEQWVKAWVEKGRIQPNQIAILSPYRQKKTILKNLHSIGRTPLVSNIDEWCQNKGIWVATIRAFKGLEADIVVLIDAPPVNEKPVFRTSDYYVAASRAKHLLKMLTPKPLG